METFLDGRPPIRGLLWLGLSETGFVLKHTTASDGGGGVTDTYTKQSGVPCRIDPFSKRGNENLEGERVSDLSLYVITLHPDVEVTTDDDFEVEGVGRYEILAIRKPTHASALRLEATDRT